MPIYNLNINGENHTVDVPANMPLLYVIREVLGITGPKYGCGVGICGACTSHIGTNTAARLCTTEVSTVGSQPIKTIEGLANGNQLHPVQKAWLDNDVAQCGFCQAGQIMAAVALLENHPDPANITDPEIDEAMGDAPAPADPFANICRCGTYVRIRAAIKQAGAAMGGS